MRKSTNPDLRIPATRFAYEVFVHFHISHPISWKERVAFLQLDLRRNATRYDTIIADSLQFFNGFCVQKRQFIAQQHGQIVGNEIAGGILYRRAQLKKFMIFSLKSALNQSYCLFRRLCSDCFRFVRLSDWSIDILSSQSSFYIRGVVPMMNFI